MAKKKGSNKGEKKDATKTTRIKSRAAKEPEVWKKGKSRTVRAGLCTSVPLARKSMKLSWPAAVSADADVAMAAVQEWVMRQIILGAAEEAGDKKSLLANDVEAARKKNPDIQRLVRGRVCAVYVK